MIFFFSQQFSTLNLFDIDWSKFSLHFVPRRGLTSETALLANDLICMLTWCFLVDYLKRLRRTAMIL